MVWATSLWSTNETARSCTGWTLPREGRLGIVFVAQESKMETMERALVLALVCALPQLFQGGPKNGTGQETHED